MYVHRAPFWTPALIWSNSRSHGSSQMNRGIRAMNTHTITIALSRSAFVQSRRPATGSHGSASAVKKHPTTTTTNPVDATTCETPP